MTDRVFKWVGRYDPTMRMLRLGRWVWMRGIVGDGAGYSGKLSIGLHPVLFGLLVQQHGWILSVAGFRMHLERSYGGIYV